MKLDFKKINEKNLFFLGCEKPKNEEEFIIALLKCVDAIKKAQKTRKENTLGEQWGIDCIEELLRGVK